MLQKQPELQIIGEATNGLGAVQIAQQLQPDLILLDMGLPTISGLEAARRIRELSPRSKILFVSENRSWDIARATFATGADGYVVKSNAASELLPAVNAVLEGKRFVSASLTAYSLNGSPNQQTAEHPHSDSVVTFPPPQKLGITRHHEVGFYSQDHYFLEHV